MVFRRHRVSLGLSVHIWLRATSAKKLRESGERKERTALTAESDCCTATHRAKTSRGRLFKFLFIFGTINKWSACVNTWIYRSLLGCHNPAALPDAHGPLLKKNYQGGNLVFAACWLLWCSQRIPLVQALAPCASAVPLSKLFLFSTCKPAPAGTTSHSKGALISAPTHLHLAPIFL